jgi:pSer/pThr/pTyr-binding forkhead associated (FHA) protein
MINNEIVESLIELLVSGMSPRFVTISGPLSGQTFYLDKPVVSIGRLAANNICLDDPFVSRQHCVIRTEGDEYTIEDLNSANGTYVNGERVKECSLAEGALIQIGASRFLFRLQNPEETMAISQNLISSNGERPLSGSTRLG